MVKLHIWHCTLGAKCEDRLGHRHLADLLPDMQVAPLLLFLSFLCIFPCSQVCCTCLQRGAALPRFPWPSFGLRQLDLRLHNPSTTHSSLFFSIFPSPASTLFASAPSPACIPTFSVTPRHFLCTAANLHHSICTPLHPYPCKSTAPKSLQFANHCDFLPRSWISLCPISRRITLTKYFGSWRPSWTFLMRKSVSKIHFFFPTQAYFPLEFCNPWSENDGDWTKRCTKYLDPFTKKSECKLDPPSASYRKSSSMGDPGFFLPKRENLPDTTCKQLSKHFWGLWDHRHTLGPSIEAY